MIPEARRTSESAQAVPAQQSAARRILGELFPPSAGSPPLESGRRWLRVVIQVAAVGLGAVLLLLRIPGVPSWDDLHSDDYPIFLVQALQHPWQLYTSNGGYVQLLPRAVAQLATYLPLTQVSRVFAASGALVAAGCGLFIFHASAGHIRSVTLRFLLGAAVVLLPIAPMEIADSNVGAPWYLLLALFWAVLWRPRTRTGMAVAAVIAFATAASTIMVIVFSPLLAARLFVLRRPREHAVTAGWLAGCLFQLPAIIWSSAHHQSRLAGHSTLGNSLAVYAHNVVLPSLGWHLAWRLQSLAGRNGATVIVAVILAVIVGAILLTQARSRPFVVTALLTGFIFTVFCATINPRAALTATPSIEPGARYTVLPIFLIEAAVIVGVDRVLRQQGGIRPRPAMAVTATVAVLAASWVADFRYPGMRSVLATRPWVQIADKWQHDCENSKSGEIVEKPAFRPQQIPCSRLRR
jgi:hypothetical protein